MLELVEVSDLGTVPRTLPTREASLELVEVSDLGTVVRRSSAAFASLELVEVSDLGTVRPVRRAARVVAGACRGF